MDTCISFLQWYLHQQSEQCELLFSILANIFREKQTCINIYVCVGMDDIKYLITKYQIITILLIFTIMHNNTIIFGVFFSKFLLKKQQKKQKKNPKHTDFVGVRLVLVEATTFPEVLNHLSEAQLVALIQRRFLDSISREGKVLAERDENPFF